MRFLIKSLFNFDGETKSRIFATNNVINCSMTSSSGCERFKVNFRIETYYIEQKDFLTTKTGRPREAHVRSAFEAQPPAKLTLDP